MLRCSFQVRMGMLITISCLTLSNPAQAIDKKEFSGNLPERCQNKTLDFDQQLECAQKYFIVDGDPINKLIIKDLQGSLADRGDQVVSIDLLGSQESNKYSLENLLPGEHYSYSVEGSTTSGVFVLRTVESSGGSGVFNSLLLVRIVKGMGFGDVTNGRLTLDHKRILIEKLGLIVLGDRVKTDITVEGNSIFIRTEETTGPQSAQKNTKKITLTL